MTDQPPTQWTIDDNGGLSFADGLVTVAFQRQKGQVWQSDTPQVAYSALVAAVRAAHTLPAQLGKWRQRSHATVYERAAWIHDTGGHADSEHPYSFCPRCEMEHPEGRRAQLEAERDALAHTVEALRAMVDCCRELVAEGPVAKVADLAAIVGWPETVTRAEDTP